jgi:GMP synthase (glutamine-hydrolysing)
MLFDAEAKKIEGGKLACAGPIYPDIIESLSITGTVIKSHHNVGWTSEILNLKLCEPVRSPVQRRR